MPGIFTQASLQHRSAHELRALYHQLQTELAASPEGSAMRRNALASLENVSRALRARMNTGPRI